MSKNKNSIFSFFKNMVLLLSGASLVVFVVSATVVSLFGYSLWSWVNVLRFVLGGFMVITLVMYVALVKILLATGLSRKK